ncbi:hypothetical protein FL857_09355 [Criibacterium bergeronii]|uniref:Uncharacterized protein n=1 Tax=Criibacterium bergeronii TaxID=1871336 RepID=A0A552V0N0_9FIRM|nr:hypothetical protein [Criibacterium bergeronii]TRW24041.1 hypothetical protein FL857_09355 [Criibacterium bergeronii]
MNGYEEDILPRITMYSRGSMEEILMAYEDTIKLYSDIPDFFPWALRHLPKSKRLSKAKNT